MCRTTIDPTLTDWCTSMLYEKVKSATLYELVDTFTGSEPQFENVVTEEIHSRGSFDIFLLLKIKMGDTNAIRKHYDTFITKCIYVDEITTYFSVTYPKRINLPSDCKMLWEISDYRRADEKSDLDFIITKIREMMTFIQTDD